MDEHETDYKQFERERMYSLADLVEEIWRRIWLILVLAVVFAVLCAGWKYMSDRSKAAASVNTSSYDRAVSSLSEKEIGDIDSVLRLYADVEATEEYLNESVRMNIDPYHEDVVTMQFVLETEDAQRADALQALGYYVTEGALAADLSESHPDVETRFLTELVSFDAGSMSTALSDEEIYPSSVFTVRVIGADAEEASQLADEVEQCLTAQAGTLRDVFGSCGLELLDRTEAQVYDSDLQLEQTTALTNQITQQNRITTQEGYLSDTQLTVLNAMLAQGSDTVRTEVDGASAGQTTASAHVRISVRYTLLGVLIGIVLGIIVIVLYYIARGTLNVDQEIEGEFGLALLGKIQEKKQRNPLVRGWRRLVYKRKPLPPETGRQIVRANLKTFCKKNGVDRVLLTGSRQDLTENASLEEIRTALAEDGIEAEIADSLPDSPETLERLLSAPCVVLVETLHKSYYRNVVRETELCADQGIPVAGVIVFD